MPIFYAFFFISVVLVFLIAYDLVYWHKTVDMLAKVCGVFQMLCFIGWFVLGASIQLVFGEKIYYRYFSKTDPFMRFIGSI